MISCKQLKNKHLDREGKGKYTKSFKVVDVVQIFTTTAMTTLLTKKKKKNPTSCHISDSPHQSTAWITEIFFNSSFTISSNLGKALWVQGVVWVYSIFYKANEHEADSAVEHKFGKAIGS